MLNRFDAQDGSDLSAPNPSRKGWVVLHTDEGEKIKVLSWGVTEAGAIAHAVANRPNHESREEFDKFLADECGTYPATQDLLGALDEDEDAPWAFEPGEGVLDLDTQAIRDLETQAEAYAD